MLLSVVCDTQFVPWVVFVARGCLWKVPSFLPLHPFMRPAGRAACGSVCGFPSCSTAGCVVLHQQTPVSENKASGP